jgi:hypothetical protein
MDKPLKGTEMTIYRSCKTVANKLLLFSLIAISVSYSAHAQTSGEGSQPNKTPGAPTLKISITAGNKIFPALLYDNETTQALIAQFPMTVDMTELNGNEKYYYLPKKLPVDKAIRPDQIRAGDIMLYSGYSIVFFYKTFSTSYSYVRLGQIDDSSNLASALGPGNVTVTFSLDN